jgi:hypothetical protein
MLVKGTVKCHQRRRKNIIRRLCAWLSPSGASWAVS